MPDSRLEAFPPELLAAYQPLRPLGQGAIGTVFLARDLALDRAVAVKILQAEVDADLRARFTKAAASLARVKHRNVMELYVHGFTPAGPYLVMEYVEGTTLDRPPPGLDVLATMLQVADGLETVHRQGLVHRDLKPSNLAVTPEGRAVILDFDLVWDPTRTRTAEGMVLGTLAFLAPELLEGSAPTPAADWYAWGITLFSLLEGRRPFGPDELQGFLKGEGLPVPELRRTPPGSPVGRLALACLSRSPAERPHGPREIRLLLDGQPLPLPRPQAPAPVEGSRALPVPGERSGSHTPLETRSGRTSGRKGRSAWPRVTGACLVAGLIAGFAWYRGLGHTDGPIASAAIPSDPGTSHPGSDPAVPSELGPDFLEAARRELDRAPDTWISRSGEAVPMEEAEADPQARELLDGDPQTWPSTLAHLPAASRFHAWVRSGGKPEGLPEGLRKALGDLDRRYRALGTGQPFSPWLELGPSPAPEPWPSRHGPEFERLAGPMARGWLATAVRNLEATHRLGIELGVVLEEAGRGVPHEEVPPEVVRFTRRLPGLRPEDLALMVAPDAESRRGYARWAREGADHLAAGIVALARTVREEPENRELAALVAYRSMHSSWGLGLSWFGYLDPELFLAGAEAHPAGAMVGAEICWLFQRFRRTPALDGPRLESGRLDFLEAAAVPSGSRLGTLRYRNALVTLFEELFKDAPAERILRTWRARRGELRDLPALDQARIALALSEASGRSVDPIGLEPGTRTWILGSIGILEEHDAVIAQRSRNQRARLEATPFPEGDPSSGIRLSSPLEEEVR